MAANQAIADAGTPTGAVSVPEPSQSLVGMLSSDPEGGNTAAESAASESKPKSGARRRQAVEPEDGQGAAASDAGEPADDPNDAGDPDGDDDKGQKPSEEEDAKTLLESYKKGNERLKNEKAKLRADVTDLRPKAALLDKYEATLGDPATAGQFLDHLLGVVADGQFGGDKVAALASMGYTAKPREAIDQIGAVKDALFAKIAETVPTMGFADGDDDVFIRFGQQIAEQTLGAIAPLLAKQPAAQTAVPPGTVAATASEAALAQEMSAAVREIQEEAPLFKVTLEEAKAAKDEYPKYALEDSLRLKYSARLNQEIQKQEGKLVTPQRAMTPSNGKVGRDSQLSHEATMARAKEGTAISLADAFREFEEIAG